MNPKRPQIIWDETKLRLMRDYFPTMLNYPLALWIGCSVRTLQRKAKELGISKVPDFNTVKADAISRIISDGVKKAYAEGRKKTQFRKGVRNNPGGEFTEGHHYDMETEARRIERIRSAYRRKKLLKRYETR